MTENETIPPLIQICRKLEVLNTKQSTSFIGQLCNIFQHDSKLLTKILLSGFCKHHKLISTTIFTKIDSLLPDEEALNLNDSICNILSPIEVNKENEESQLQSVSMTLSELPKDLTLHICNLLPIADLCNLEATSRWLCIVSRNPNSCNYLAINYSDLFQNSHLFDVYSHFRFSKVESLYLYNDRKVEYCWTDEQEHNQLNGWSNVLSKLTNLQFITRRPPTDSHDHDHTFHDVDHLFFDIFAEAIHKTNKFSDLNIDILFDHFPYQYSNYGADSTFDSLQQMLPCCSTLYVYFELDCYVDENMYVDIPGFVFNIINQHVKSCEKLIIHFEVYANDHISVELDALGTDLVGQFLEACEEYFDPFLRFTSDIMKQIGMKYIEIKIQAFYSFHQDIEQGHERRCPWLGVYPWCLSELSVWNENVKPKCYDRIKSKYDKRCVIDHNNQYFNIMLQLTSD